MSETEVPMPPGRVLMLVEELVQAVKQSMLGDETQS